MNHGPLFSITPNSITFRVDSMTAEQCTRTQQFLNSLTPEEKQHLRNTLPRGRACARSLHSEIGCQPFTYFGNQLYRRLNALLDDIGEIAP